jgi:hypothetical protein
MSIRIVQPRCPLCHDEVRGSEAQAACVACRAWHHADCWSEREARCAACHAQGERPVTHVRLVAQGVTVDGLVLWVATCGAAFFAEQVTAAFARMFREVGVSLPWSTELVLGPARWLLPLVVLTLLHVGALAPRWRSRLHAASIVALLGAVGFAVIALFLPLTSTCSKL